MSRREETCRWQVSGGAIHKKALTFRSELMLALPIFPASHPASIVGADELNFCVRDGNRWTLIAINTNYFPFPGAPRKLLLLYYAFPVCQALSSLVTPAGFEPTLTA